VLGRTFEPSDTSGPPAPVIILGYDLWQRKFNGDPNILGKPVTMSRRAVAPKVIGVMAPGIRFLPSPGAAQEPNYNVNATVDFWLPTAPNPARLKARNWDVIGRLRPGVTTEQGQADLKVITARQAQQEPEFEGFTPHAQALTDEMN